MIPGRLIWNSVSRLYLCAVTFRADGVIDWPSWGWWPLWGWLAAWTHKNKKRYSQVRGQWAALLEWLLDLSLLETWSLREHRRRPWKTVRGRRGAWGEWFVLWWVVWPKVGRVGCWIGWVGEWVGGSRTSRIENGVIQNGLIEVGAMPESSLAKLGLKHKQTPYLFWSVRTLRDKKKGGWGSGWVQRHLFIPVQIHVHRICRHHIDISVMRYLFFIPKGA